MTRDNFAGFIASHAYNEQFTNKEFWMYAQAAELYYAKLPKEMAELHAQPPNSSMDDRCRFDL